MPYYLKIAHGSKTKKFIVKSPHQINLHQARNSFNPPITSTHLSYELVQPNDKEKSRFFKSQSALLQYLETQQYAQKATVKLTIYNTSTQNDEDELSESLNFGLQKNKSKSEEIKVQLKTSQFTMRSLQITQQFLFMSLSQNKEKKEQAAEMVKNAQKKMIKLKSKKTNTSDLLEFLNS